MTEKDQTITCISSCPPSPPNNTYAMAHCAEPDHFICSDGSSGFQVCNNFCCNDEWFTNQFPFDFCAQNKYPPISSYPFLIVFFSQTNVTFVLSNIQALMAKGNDGLWASFLPASRGKTPQDLENLDFLRVKNLYRPHNMGQATQFVWMEMQNMLTMYKKQGK